MIIEYKEVNDKVIAYDNKEGLKEYDNQKNIKEIIKQENVIEEIKTSLTDLKEEANYINSYKKSLYKMLVNQNYGNKIKLLIFISIATLLLCQAYLTLSPIILAGMSSIFLATTIAVSNIQYKNYKKDMSLKSINIENQIKEFNENLETELKVLIELKKDKTKSDKINSNKVVLSSKSNKKIVDIQNKKRLYETYRQNCSKIKKYLDKFDNMFDESYNKSDVENINSMYNDGNKVLSKRKNQQ